MIRPSACARNTGNAFLRLRTAGLAALVRCSMSAVMKIVLPDRESPVTPRRICGPLDSSMRFFAAARASNIRSEMRGKSKPRLWLRLAQGYAASGASSKPRLGTRAALIPAQSGGEQHELEELFTILSRIENSWLLAMFNETSVGAALLTVCEAL